MISARAGRIGITNILLEGEHIDQDIQENVSGCVFFPSNVMASGPHVLGAALSATIFTNVCTHMMT